MRRSSVVIILIFGLTLLWQGCGSGSNSPSGGGGRGVGGGGGGTTTYLAYLDPVAANVNIASIPTSGILASATGSPYLAGSQPVSMAVTPDGKFFYVVNSSSGNVSEFATATNGGLTQPVPPIATGVQPVAMAIDSSDRFAVVVNRGASTLSTYSVNSSTGVLAATGPGVALHVASPQSVAVNGNFVFVANATAIDVLLYNPANGTFSFGTGSSIGTPSTLNLIALYAPPQATGVLYALDTSTNSIVTYNVSNTGVLTQGASIPVGSQPAAMIPDPANRYLFVANQGSSNLSVFAVDATTGTLTPAATPLVSTGTAPNTLAYDPANNFLFVGLSGTKQIQTYAVTTGTGALTVKGSPFTVNNAPSAMVVAKP